MGQLIVLVFEVQFYRSQLAGKRQGRFSAPGAKRSIMAVDETNAGAPLSLDPYLPYLNLSISTIEASTCIINQ